MTGGDRTSRHPFPWMGNKQPIHCPAGRASSCRFLPLPHGLLSICRLPLMLQLYVLMCVFVSVLSVVLQAIWGQKGKSKKRRKDNICQYFSMKNIQQKSPWETVLIFFFFFFYIILNRTSVFMRQICGLFFM